MGGAETPNQFRYHFTVAKAFPEMGFSLKDAVFLPQNDQEMTDHRTKRRIQSGLVEITLGLGVAGLSHSKLGIERRFTCQIQFLLGRTL